jgi:hypothetical protein
MTTQLNRRAPRATTATRPPERRAAHRPAREARTKRSYDGVVASYVRSLAAGGGTRSA